MKKTGAQRKIFGKKIPKIVHDQIVPETFVEIDLKAITSVQHLVAIMQVFIDSKVGNPSNVEAGLQIGEKAFEKYPILNEIIKAGSSI